MENFKEADETEMGPGDNYERIYKCACNRNGSGGNKLDTRKREIAKIGFQFPDPPVKFSFQALTMECGSRQKYNSEKCVDVLISKDMQAKPKYQGSFSGERHLKSNLQMPNSEKTNHDL